MPTSPAQPPTYGPSTPKAQHPPTSSPPARPANAETTRTTKCLRPQPSRGRLPARRCGRPHWTPSRRPVGAVSAVATWPRPTYARPPTPRPPTAHDAMAAVALGWLGRVRRQWRVRVALGPAVPPTGPDATDTSFGARGPLLIGSPTRPARVRRGGGEVGLEMGAIRTRCGGGRPIGARVVIVESAARFPRSHMTTVILVLLCLAIAGRELYLASDKRLPRPRRSCGTCGSSSTTSSGSTRP